jgi:hypothetical protein
MAWIWKNGGTFLFFGRYNPNRNAWTIGNDALLKIEGG